MAAIKPGTKAFGDRAAARKERLDESARKGDVRVRTAYGVAKNATRLKNKIISGD